MSKTVILVILALGVGVGGGYLFGISRGAVPAPKIAVVPTPSPSPEAKSDFNNDKAEVKLADGQKFIYVLDGGLEKTLTDLTGISVWKLPAEGTEAAQIKWDGLKAGDKVQIASEKASGQVVAVLVL